MKQCHDITYVVCSNDWFCFRYRTDHGSQLRIIGECPLDVKIREKSPSNFPVQPNAVAVVFRKGLAACGLKCSEKKRGEWLIESITYPPPIGVWALKTGSLYDSYSFMSIHVTFQEIFQVIFLITDAVNQCSCIFFLFIFFGYSVKHSNRMRNVQ